MSRSREAILAAYAELIEEVGNDDVSYRLIARRAGVGERTVYRYYSTRAQLVLATADWIERSVFTRELVTSVFDVPLAIRDSMAAYEAHPELAHVVAEAAMRGVAGTEPMPWRDHIDGLLRAEAPRLSDEGRRTVVAALAHIDSATNWVSLRREFELTGRDAADAAAWAAEAVLDEVRLPAG